MKLTFGRGFIRKSAHGLLSMAALGTGGKGDRWGEGEAGGWWSC